MKKFKVDDIGPGAKNGGELSPPQPCKHKCGRLFVWAPAKGKHEKSCAAAVEMVGHLDEQKGWLHTELVEYLMKKRTPVVALLAEIDSMIRALGGK